MPQSLVEKRISIVELSITILIFIGGLSTVWSNLNSKMAVMETKIDSLLALTQQVQENTINIVTIAAKTGVVIR